jgi:hypothetical protein
MGAVGVVVSEKEHKGTSLAVILEYYSTSAEKCKENHADKK